MQHHFRHHGLTACSLTNPTRDRNSFTYPVGDANHTPDYSSFTNPVGDANPTPDDSFFTKPV